MIVDKGNRLELKVIVEKYKRKKINLKGPDNKPIVDESGNKVKEIIEVYNGYYTLPTTFLKEGITLYGSVSNNRDRVLKKRATIYDRYTNKFYVVDHPTDEIEKKLNSKREVGFQIARHKTIE